MPILQNVEIHYIHLDPKRPNATFNKANPTWEIQIRTRDKAQKKEWEAMGIRVKIEEPDDAPLFYKANLNKKSFTQQKSEANPNPEMADPVTVVDGKRNPIDPNTIGNGSIANIRVFQRDHYSDPDKKVCILMGVQVTKLVKYVPKPRGFDDEFGETETVVVETEAPENNDIDSYDEVAF